MKLCLVNMCMVPALLCGLVYLPGSTPARANGGNELAAEITHLLGFVESATCQFIRNGQTYSGPRAASHMKRKYSYFKDRIKTAESFIELAATRSTVSGRIYLVRCHGKEIPTHEWLQKELAAFRQSRSKSKE